MQVLVERIANDPDFIARVAALVRQRVINAVERKFKRKLQVAEKIPSPPDRSPSASTEATSDEESKARRPRPKRRNRKIDTPDIAWSTRMKSADSPADHDHSLMQTVV